MIEFLQLFKSNTQKIAQILNIGQNGTLLIVPDESS